MEQLTLKILKEMTPGTIITKGIVKNEPDGVYMTDQRKGADLLWVAKRGVIYDWCIYIHWVESGEDYVIHNGDKIHTETYIKRLVPCDDEAFKMYRH